MRCSFKSSRATTLLLSLVLTQFAAFAQEVGRENTTPGQNNPPGRVEVPDSEEQRRFVEEHSFSNPAYRRKQRERAGVEAAPAAQVPKLVRMIYLVPSDKSVRSDYQNAIADAIYDLQLFYREQIGGGLGFSLHSPTVEVFQTPHAAAFYSTGHNSRAGGFWESVLADGFALTGGGFNDPNNRWVFYVDADLMCGQFIGGTAGVALLAANDLRGLTNQPNLPACRNQPPDPFGVNRWIGGLGHELAHTFDVPHPPGCDQGSCAGGQFAASSLMWSGYAFYPDTHLLDENKTQLRASGFFSTLSLHVVSGRVTLNNAGLAGVTMFLSGSQSRTAVTDANGSYSFSNIPAGGSYTITPSLPNRSFNPQSQVVNNLSADQAVNFTAGVVTGGPILISEEHSTRALALDSVLGLTEPFQPTYQHSWGVDNRTRIMLFATNFELSPDETSAAVTADAEDSAHQTYALPVEYVGKVPGFDWLNCIVVRLNDDLGDVGDVLVRIRYRGLTSNRVRVGIGRIGGGPPDDAGTVPTPGRPPQ